MGWAEGREGMGDTEGMGRPREQGRDGGSIGRAEGKWWPDGHCREPGLRSADRIIMRIRSAPPRPLLWCLSTDFIGMRPSRALCWTCGVMQTPICKVSRKGSLSGRPVQYRPKLVVVPSVVEQDGPRSVLSLSSSPARVHSLCLCSCAPTGSVRRPSLRSRWSTATGPAPRLCPRRSPMSRSCCLWGSR